MHVLLQVCYDQILELWLICRFIFILLRQLDTGSYFLCVFVYNTTRYWHILLMCRNVQYNYILAHISDASSCTVQLYMDTYFWCFVVYCTTGYWDIFLLLLHVLYNQILGHISDASLCTVQLKYPGGSMS